MNETNTVTNEEAARIAKLKVAGWHQATAEELEELADSEKVYWVKWQPEGRKKRMELKRWKDRNGNIRGLFWVAEFAYKTGYQAGVGEWIKFIHGPYTAEATGVDWVTTIGPEGSVTRRLDEGEK